MREVRCGVRSLANWDWRVPTFHSLLVSHRPVWDRSCLTTLAMIVVCCGGPGVRLAGVFVLQIIDILLSSPAVLRTNL